MPTPSASERAGPGTGNELVRDEERLAALHRYDVLDTDPEPAFDRIATLATHLFEAPTALVSFVDAERQWFKSAVGFEADQTRLDESVCVHTIEKGDVLTVEDLSADERFADNPYVTDHGFRFYSGAPLVTPDDRRIGTLCVLDTEPRSPSDETLDRLADLAAMVVDELELRRERTEHEQSRELLRQSQRLADVGGSAYDPQADEVAWTDQTYRIFGLSPGAELDLATAVDFYTPESRSVIEPAVERLLDEGGQYDLELDVVTADGERRHVGTIAEAQRENDETTRIVGAIQDVTEQHRDRRRKEFQNRMFERIATGTPVGDVLDEIAQFAEEEMPDATVSIQRLDDDRLYHASGPSLPEEYIAAIDGVEIGPDVGTCGTAAHHEHEVVTEDIQEDDRWDGYRAAAEEAGFRSCNSQVIQGSEGTIFGTFAIYRAEPGGLDAEERQFVKRMSHVASVALEREQRERALRESEDRWRTLVEEHPGPIHVTVDGTFAYANEALAELFGVEKPETLIGEDVLPFVHPDDRDHARERARRLTDNREATPLIENRIVRADGEERIVLVQSVPITYQGREAAQTMMWDVTEHREAERGLRQSEKKFRTVVENVQPITFMVDRDGTFVLSEGKDLQAFGLEPGEVVGESIHDVEENNPEVIHAIQRALDGEHVDTVTEANGLIFDCWYSPVHDEEGAVVAVIGMAADITERREAQRELREQKEMLQTLFDNVPVMITLIEDGELQMINEHLEEVLGWSEEALDGPTDLLERCYPDPETRRRVLDTIEEAPDEWTDERPKTKEGNRVDTTWKNVRLPDGRTFGIGVDISERKAQERELQDSNRRLRLALEAANAGTFEFDADTRQVQHMDEQTLALFGLDPSSQEIETARFEEIIHDDDFERLVESFERAAEDGQSQYEASYRVRRPNDGEVRHIRSRGLILRNEDGEPERVIGINQDVTERRERQKQLRLLEAAVEHSSAPVLITDADRLDEPGPRIVHANPAFSDMTGYDREELIGQSPRMLQGPDTDRAALNRVRAALENDEPVHEVVRNYGKDGTPYWNELYIAPVRDEEGAVTHYVSIQQDVTERRRRKQALERKNDLFKKAQDIADVGAWEYDVHAGELTVTDELNRIHGLSPDADMTIDRGVSFYHPDDRPTLRQALTDAIESGEPFDLTLRLITPDGDQRWAHGRAEPQTEEGEVVRLRGTIQDITERKEREEALRRQKNLLEQTQKLAGGWEVDLQSGTVTGSDEFWRILEAKDKAELPLEEGLQFFAAEARPRLREAHDQCIEHGTPYDLELPIVTAEGNRRWIRTVGAPAGREDGEVVEVAGAFQDITERKEAEEDLRHSREQLSMAVEGGNIGTWNWDVETGEVIFNERWAGMLGYSREELDFHFSTWEELVHPEDLTRAMEILEAYIAGDVETYDPEIRMRTKSGDWKWIQTIGKVIERDEDGDVTRAAGIHLDIDDRKRAKQALHQAKTRYQTLIEHFPDGGVFLFDENLEYTIAGGEGLEDIGLTPSDFRGKTPSDLFPAKTAKGLMRHYRKALEGEKTASDQTFEGRHYRVQTLPVRDGDGEVLAGMAVSQDITERKKTRRRLEQYQEYTDRLLNAVDDLFFALDEEAHFQRWNAQIPEVTGYSDDEINRMTAFDLVPESEHERVAARMGDAFTSGRAQIEVPLLRKDGTTIPYEFVGSLVDHPGNGLQIVGIGRDITQRKQRERLLEQAETFFQNSQDALFLIDVQQEGDEETLTIQRVNPAYETQTGFSREAVQGATPQEILGEETGRKAEAMYRRCIKQREPLEYEEELPLDGAITYWTTRIAPVVVDGEVQQIVGTTRNVTERKQRKEALERKNDLFAKAQDIANVGAWEYDVQAGELTTTDEMTRIFGHSPGTDMTVEHRIASHHPDDQPTIRAALQQAIEEGEPFNLELRLVRDDGTQRWIHSRGEPQFESGEIVRVRGTIQDVTERVRRREELEAAKETAEEADRIKSALLSNMNHEFRTPLTSIISFSDLIRENPSMAETFADRVHGGGKRLLHTLNTVMDFAELQADSASPTNKYVDVGTLAQSVVNEFAYQIERNDLSVHVQESDGAVAAVLDEHLVERVLAHLVSNAVKFSREGGEVSVTVAAGEDAITLRVRDNGVGIDPEFRPRVYDQFAQASSGHDRTHDGNGLGLTIVKRMVERMEGAISIDSTVGEGTTATVRLPAGDRPDGEPRAPVDSSS